MRKSNLLIALAVGAALAAPAARADAGDTTVGATMYADFTSISNKQDDSTGVATSVKNPAGVTVNQTSQDKDPNGLGTDVKRFYLIVNHQFDDIWSANLTTDFNFTAATAETQVFVKKAYVQAKFDDLAVLRLGSTDMPWIPYAESLYGYRFLEKTLIDRGVGAPITLTTVNVGGAATTKTTTATVVNAPSFGNSADWGVNLNGGNGMWNYSVSAVNGGGYKNPTRTKTLDFEGRVGVVPVSGLTIAAGFYTGKLGKDTEAAEIAADNNLNTKGGPIGSNTASRTDAIVDWKGMGLNVGFEWFTAKNFNGAFIFNDTTDSESGYSLFGSYDFPGTSYSVFARYDDTKPSKDLDSTMDDKYFNAGFAWKSNSNITWALAYKNEKLTDNLGYLNSKDDFKTSEFGIWAQVKF